MRTHKKFWTQEEKDLLGKVCNGTESFKTIAKKYFPNRTHMAVESACSVFGFKNDFDHRTYPPDDNFWSVPNENNSYWAGVMAADGCIYKDKGLKCRSFHWAISEVDLPLMNIFYKDAKLTCPIIRFQNTRDTGYVSKFIRVSVFSKQWMEDFEKNFNLVPLKTQRLAPPEHLEEKLLWSYLKGYTDGDGCVRISRGKEHKTLVIEYASSSIEILHWIKRMTDLKFTSRRNYGREVHSSGNKHTFSIGGQAAIQMFLFLSKLPVPCLDRKWKNPEVLELVAKEVAARPEAYKDFV